MNAICQYLLSVTTAAILCGLAKSVTHEKRAYGTMVRLVAGVLLAVTVIAPITQLHLGDLPTLTDDLTVSASRSTQSGEQLASEELTQIIKHQLSAYVLEKASMFGVELDTEFLLPDDGSFQPIGVVVRGAVPPYVRQRLTQIIAEDLGIAKEDQQWIG